MNVEKVDEILMLLNEIANNTTANKIASISLLISSIAVAVSIYYNNKTRVQYINSLNPLLSFRLIEKSNALYLIVANTGQSEATDIKITFEELKNNGKRDLEIDEVYRNVLTLYPNEQIVGRVARSGTNVLTSIAPMIRFHVSYKKGNTQKYEQYSRWICYSGNLDENKSIEQKLESISKKLEEISCSSNRMANYFEGRCLFRSDVINVFPKSNLYKDMKDAINNIDRSEKNIPGESVQKNCTNDTD